MSPAKLPIFKTTSGTFTAKEAIDEGGSGRVYKVADESGQFFAVKLLKISNTTPREKRKRFKNELFFCLKNEHPNILTIIDHGVYESKSSDSPFYVMPLFTQSLRSLITSHIPPEKVLDLFAQMLNGVEAAHLKGVIHRDLKPKNILVMPETGRLVIADFGIAHFQEEALYTAVETAPYARLANFQYAAPEQRARNLAVDQRADIHALGLILNEMYTAEVPWGTEYRTISSIVPDLEYLDDLVSAMLRQSPSDRLASIGAVKEQLIGRKNDFVVRQRLSELNKTVIPVTEVDDPLITDPPRLVNVDYARGMLTLFFQRPVNETWIWALNNMGNYTSLMGKGPENYAIARNQACIRADENLVQRIIDDFKEWLPQANSVYKFTVQQRRRDAEEQKRKELQSEIEEFERHQRVLKNVKL